MCDYSVTFALVSLIKLRTNKGKDIMSYGLSITPVAFFHSPFSSKFGVPKQSGLVDELEGYIEFVAEYRNPDFLRGIEDFDWLWLIWQFSANPHEATSPLVRPPLLGGNEKVGVFASRSPFRPNALGLSSVRLDRVDYRAKNGPRIYVRGADLMDGTPIYDIKPYVSIADCHQGVRCGFVDKHEIRRLKVDIPVRVAGLFTGEQLFALRKVLELDPRPHYHNDSAKLYGMSFMEYDVKFCVDDGVLTVVDIVGR